MVFSRLMESPPWYTCRSLFLASQEKVIYNLCPDFCPPALCLQPRQMTQTVKIFILAQIVMKEVSSFLMAFTPLPVSQWKSTVIHRSIWALRNRKVSMRESVIPPGEHHPTRFVSQFPFPTSQNLHVATGSGNLGVTALDFQIMSLGMNTRGAPAAPPQIAQLQLLCSSPVSNSGLTWLIRIGMTSVRTHTHLIFPVALHSDKSVLGQQYFQLYRLRLSCRELCQLHKAN